MNRNITQEQFLNAAECAEALGVTVRALRVYERQGLLAPKRTGKNWRVYGPQEVARLHEILALKQLGLSLTGMKKLLAGKTTDLASTLRMQSVAMQDVRDRADRGLAIIAASQATIAAGQDVSLQELITLIQETSMTESRSDTTAWRRYEQARPRIEIAMPLDRLDDYSGCFQLTEASFLYIVRQENQLFGQVTAQPAVPLFAEAPDRFFFKVVPAQISFVREAAGSINALILHQHGNEFTAHRVSEAAALHATQALNERIEKGIPLEHGEALVRRLIQDQRSGDVDFTIMTEDLALVVREQLPLIQQQLQQLGALQGLAFKEVNDEGWDVYRATFKHGEIDVSLVLAADGKLAGVLATPVRPRSRWTPWRS